MLAYHGSCVTGLARLRPFHRQGSNYDAPVVYLSTLPAVAALYVYNKPFKWLTYGFDVNGKPVYTESFPDSLSYFYRGVSGCVYACDGDFEYVESVGIRCAVISRAEVSVSDTLVVPDAYEFLLQAERDGELSILRYNEHTASRRARTERMVRRAIESERDEPGFAEFAAEVFPEFW
ncbi:MAG: hypothetical protein LBN30_00635 [Oscillospiraceae bacterium]|jgi:hypothetical protein|nr:hypothetical protein [Oscillospiraceae bacterium]